MTNRDKQVEISKNMDLFTKGANLPPQKCFYYLKAQKIPHVNNLMDLMIESILSVRKIEQLLHEITKLKSCWGFMRFVKMALVKPRNLLEKYRYDDGKLSVVRVLVDFGVPPANVC